MDRKTNKIKSRDNIFHTLKIVAPNTFRIPISFVRWLAVKDARPKMPKQLIEIASAANTLGQFTNTLFLVKQSRVIIIYKFVIKRRAWIVFFYN